jgi:hypothetical protein
MTWPRASRARTTPSRFIIDNFLSAIFYRLLRQPILPAESETDWWAGVVVTPEIKRPASGDAGGSVHCA